MKKVISIVCPIYNEELSILPFFNKIDSIFSTIEDTYELIFIDDGSTDNTLNKVKEISNTNKNVKYISLTRNFGKDAALTAGLTYSTGDAVIPIDVDLQDPPILIPKMIKLWKEGYDVILPRRESRNFDTFGKRFTANLYYSILKKIGEPHLEKNVGDFRLMSRQVVESALSLNEKTRYMKGILSWVGYNVFYINFPRPKRLTGKTSFSYTKLICHALNGLTGFSILPLRFFTISGIIISSTSILYGIFIILNKLMYGINESGYASLIVAILFIGGIQILSIGVLGEYIGKVLLEVKNRPIYIVKEMQGWK